MSLYDNEENAVVNNPGGTSETPSNLVNNNVDNLVSKEELDEILQYKKDGNVNESKLSPNPAGFGFTKQEFVDVLPNIASAQPNTLYILKVKNDGIVVGYRLYKYIPFGNGQDAHYEQYGATPDLKLVEGPREQKAIENTAPQEKPEKVFNGDVVFKGKTTNNDGDINSVVANPTGDGHGEALDKIKIGSKIYNVLTIDEVVDLIIGVVNNTFVGTTLYSNIASFGPGNVANLAGSFINNTIEL